ncbi:MAG TPA: hypothetical protein VMD08_09590 [Candidatus Baltobacteraceae bacterium]|nr:hypothetical protein [Candidatus Baltobacteraceae bacterium]
MPKYSHFLFAGMFAGCLGICAPVHAQVAAESKDMRLLAHHDLNGQGDGGEGMALQAIEGRRILYLAHESQKTCLSILDVTNPEQPMLLNQLPSPGPGTTRCNSLGLAGNVLAVANQTAAPGQRPAGMWLLDVSRLDAVTSAKSLDDLRLGFFDTSGARSRGVHWLWFVDGAFAHLATGAADFVPTNPRDDQFYMVVDVRDPRRPKEVARWWLPGTRQGDACLPLCQPARHAFDDGYRAHNIGVWPERPDRAYIGYIDGGAIILDIAGLAEVRAGRWSTFRPRLVSRLRFAPPFPAWTHTVQPIFERQLAVVTDEAVLPKCADAPKLAWLLDIRNETNPVILGTAPLPDNAGELCARGDRFGAHNVQPNFPNATTARLTHTFAVTFFNGGVRLYRLVDAAIPHAPPRIEEIAFYIPAAPPGNANGVSVINHVLVDEHGILYICDRVSGGLYVLEYTGPTPLD